jgi:Zn-dependent protease with chaperone function
MTSVYRVLVSFCIAILLTTVAPRLGPGPQAATHRVHRAQPETAPPVVASNLPAYSLPADKLTKAVRLSQIRVVLDIAGSLWGVAALWLLLATRATARLAAWSRFFLSRRWMQGWLFFTLILVITALASLPLDIAGHMASRHYGISVQGWGSWLADQFKGLGLTVLFAAPILLLFNRLVRFSPRRYWIWGWLVSLPLIVLSVLAEPLIEPVFNTFEPLAKNHSALVAQLETVVARTGTEIAPDRMFLMKASEKSNGINAYVTGIGATKRYVMWDTATDRLPDDEILFIFGHESGHYVLHHIPKILAGTTIGLFFVFWGCARFASWLVYRFGARWRLGGIDGMGSLCSRQGFVVLLLALSVANIILLPVSNTFSRYFEHQADVYGQEAIHGLVPDPQKTAVSAFNHLGQAWLEDPHPSPLVEFWEYNHPSVQTRANFAQHYDPWADGGHGEYFDK